MKRATKIQKIILAGVDESILYLDQEYLEEIITTQRTNDDIFKTYHVDFDILELSLNGDKLDKIKVYSQVENREISVTSKMTTLKLPTSEANIPFDLKLVDRSKNWTGGAVPRNMVIKNHSDNFTINMVASLDHESFPVLPFSRLNIFCPEFLKGVLFIDYSDCNMPLIMNEEEIDKVQYPDATKPFEINVFDKQYFEVVRAGGFGDDAIGHSGIPMWLQNIQVPRCPKTNDVMKFVACLTRDAPVSQDLNSYHSLAYLYIFINPKTNIVGLLYQM